jgi:protoporphyrinogen oxidase
MPLERITAVRASKLMYEQAAPKGFWYAAGGIGQLMDAMAAEVRRLGGQILTNTRVRNIRVADGRVFGVAAQTGDQPVTVDAPRLVAGIPGPLVASLVDPPAPEGVIPRLAPRAAALVYLLVDKDRLTDQAWIQIDDPRAPFARMSEAKNWSHRLVPDGQTVIGCECYCALTSADPAWGLDDTALGQACATALRDPLGLVDEATKITPLEVVRIPRAWSLVEADGLREAAAPYEWLAEIEGLTVAQGGDVIQAIAAGEQAGRGA